MLCKYISFALLCNLQLFVLNVPSYFVQTGALCCRVGSPHCAKYASSLQTVFEHLFQVQTASVYLFDVSRSRYGEDRTAHTHKHRHTSDGVMTFLPCVVSCQQACRNLQSNPRCGKYPCKSECETRGTEAQEAFSIYRLHTDTHCFYPPDTPPRHDLKPSKTPADGKRCVCTCWWG